MSDVPSGDSDLSVQPGDPHDHGDEVSEPGRPWLLRRLGLERLDLLAMGVLLVVAFVFRFFSPLMPDILTRPFAGAPISNCVRHTPIDARNDTGTLCGLAYPFQRSYAQSGQPPTPPNGQVFDEIYFGVFAHNDLKGISYFDPEPPLAKYGIAAGEWLYGAWRKLTLGLAGDPADLGFNTFGWRIAVCLFGTLTVPLMYLLAFKLWPNRLFAVAAGTMCCFDGLFFIQSRIGMIDIIPIFFTMLAYVLFLVHLESRTPRGAMVTLLLVGAVLGFAISSKWTTLAAWATIGLFLAGRPLIRRIGIRVGQWSWGPLPGPALPGGARAESYAWVAVVSLVVVPMVIYTASWIPFFLRGQFHTFGDLVSYQYEMYHYHATLTATHPYGSKWYTWPFLYRPVAYYYEAAGLGTDAFTGQPLVAGMVNLGNPLIWWASIPALLSLPYFVLRHRSFPAAVMLVGFLTAYLPFAGISRVLFLYHMFGGLIFMILALAFVLARMHEAGPVMIAMEGREVGQLSTRWLVPAFLALVVVTFLYFYPVWTGLPISQGAYLGGFLQGGKMWLRTWI